MPFPVHAPISLKAGEPPVLDIVSDPGAGPAITIDGVGVEGGGGGLIDFVRVHRPTGLDYNSTTFTDLEPDGSLDLVLNASAGDVIEVSLSTICSAGSFLKHLDVVTRVGGEVKQALSSGGGPAHADGGFHAWRADSTVWNIGGAGFMVLTADSIDNGTVTLRFRGRRLTPGLASLGGPINAWAKNHGPIEVS